MCPERENLNSEKKKKKQECFRAQFQNRVAVLVDCLLSGHQMSLLDLVQGPITSTTLLKERSKSYSFDDSRPNLTPQGVIFLLLYRVMVGI